MPPFDIVHQSIYVFWEKHHAFQTTAMVGVVGWPASGLQQCFFACFHSRKPASQSHQHIFFTHSFTDTHCHGFASAFPNAFSFADTVAYSFSHPQSLVWCARGNDHFGRRHLSRPG